LTNKRAILLDRIYKAYEAEYRKNKMSAARKKKLAPNQLHQLVEIGISSGSSPSFDFLAFSEF
jgi:hypothetical protein